MGIVIVAVFAVAVVTVTQNSGDVKRLAFTERSVAADLHHAIFPTQQQAMPPRLSSHQLLPLILREPLHRIHLPRWRRAWHWCYDVELPRSSIAYVVLSTLQAEVRKLIIEYWTSITGW